MGNVIGVASLNASAHIPVLASGYMYGASHTKGQLHRPGETASLGLVMMGAAEFVGPRDVIPSGTNREYGYWRGSQNISFIDKFDQAWLPLEGSGVTAGVPNVKVVVSAKGGGTPTGSDGFYGSTCSEAELCTWMWDGADWTLSSNACPDGCGCEGTNPSGAGSFPGDAVSTACTGGDSTPGETGGTGENVGFARWEKAGALRTQIGEEAIQNRCLFLSKRSFVNVGSGIDLSQKAGYSIYAKVVPSGDVTGTVILAQHRENPAQFVLGCDYEGKYYIRSDFTDEGENKPVFARSAKSFEEYQYPAHVFGVYASGDNRLRIYVNGNEEGVSESAFTRSRLRSANTNVTVGKREFAIAERGFTGWIDEAGITNETVEAKDIKEFYKNTFEVTDLIFNAKVTPTGSSGLSGKEFGDTGLDALNTTFVEFVANSGAVGRLNEAGDRGGAFDKQLWGQDNFAISSVLTFDLTQIPPKFHQLTDLSVDMWVEHLTNHPSGADLSVRLIHKDRVSGERNLNWHPSGISVPSGSKRLISINHPLPTLNYYDGGQKNFNQDFDDHQLQISLKYPKSSHPYDANFRIYSTKMNFSGFDSLTSYDTQVGETEAGVIKGHSIVDVDGRVIGYASGDRSLTLMSFGASPVPSNVSMNMFVDVGTADQGMNLVLNQDLKTSLGNSGYGYLIANGAVAMSGQRMNLFTAGGKFNASMSAFLKTDDWLDLTSTTVPLEIEGTNLSYPRSQIIRPLFLLADSGAGEPSGVMNLVLPNTKAPLLVGRRLLYVEGRKPVADIPLYVQVGESGVKTMPLYTVAPDFNTPSGNMNMFVKQKDFYGVASIGAVASILGTGNIPLFMKADWIPSGIMNFAMPNVLGSGTNTTTLNIKGYQ